MSKFGRRHFLGGVAGAVGGGIVVGCAAPDRESRVQSFVLAPEQSLPGENIWFATACAHTNWGNSVVVRTVDGRAIKVEGNPGFPINQGKTHVRTQAGTQSLYHPDRLNRPMQRVGERGKADFREITWDEALDLLIEHVRPPRKTLMITGRLAGTKARIAQAFVEGLGGTHMVYEPLESTVLYEAIRRIFGSTEIPHFDFKNAKSVLSFGADFLATWVSPVQYSAGYSQFRHGQGRERGLFTQFEPRMSMTASNADRVVYVSPGEEGAVALSIAHVIVSEGLIGQSVWADTVDAVGGMDALQAFAPEQLEARTGVSAETIRTVAREFASHQPGFAIVGGPALAQTNGLDNGAAVLLLNRIVGNAGIPGGVLPNPKAPEAIPMPLRPNSFEDWASLTRSIDAGEGPNAVFVYDSDPFYGLPANLGGFVQAVTRGGYIVGMASFMNDTMAYADLLLPATHPFEEWGDFTADPADGRLVVGYQQPVVVPSTESRSLGDLLLTIAPELLGQDKFPWPAMQAAVKSTAEGLFGGLTAGKTPQQSWIEILRNGGVWNGVPAQTPAFSARPDWKMTSLAEPKFDGEAGQYPLHLIPFETITKGFGIEATTILLQAAPDPLTTVTWTTWVELNPETAKKIGVQTDDLVEIKTAHGKISVSVYVTPVAAPDVIGVPMGMGRLHGGRWDAGKGANVLSILSPSKDSGTGALAWAATRAQVQKTGKSKELPVFEFHRNPRNDDEAPPVQVTRE